LQRRLPGGAAHKEARMATHMTSPDLDALDVIPYQDLRSTLKSGDLMFASGEYLVSKTIREFTHSPWSHVGIVFRIDSIDRVLLLESVEDMGVRFAPLSKYLTDYAAGKPYRGRIVLARCAGIDATALENMARFGIDELTRPYDNDEIAAIVARIALGLGRRRHDRQYICSELVYECFHQAGTEFKYDRRGFISPENVWADENVSLVARIR
jgi:hypothetical protein